jgi:hydroxymethylbilane synthase
MLLSATDSTQIEETLICGARSSPLSRVQVNEILRSIQLFHPGLRFAVEYMQTRGDKDQKSSLRDLGKGDFFTRELDRRLLDGVIECSIHSAKDLPEPLPEGLSVAAITHGLDPRDSLVFRSGENLKTLAPGAKIATSSERREEIVRSYRSDLAFCDVRGPIEERLRLVDEGMVDGAVIAEAALIRLGLTHRSRLILPDDTVPLQGQLAILVREEDHRLKELFAPLDKRQHPDRCLYLGTDPTEFNPKGKLHHHPVITIEPSVMTNELLECLRAVKRYTHLIFTSKNGVELFVTTLQRLGIDLAEYGGKSIVAVGAVTKKKLIEYGLNVEHCPLLEQAEGVVELLESLPLDDAHVLIPCSRLSRDVLPAYLAERGVVFTKAELYSPVPNRERPLPPLGIFSELFFTSPSTVSAFLEVHGSLPSGKELSTQGAITRARLQELGA